MLRYCHHTLGMTTFYAKIGYDNSPSLALFLRMGFVAHSRSDIFREATLVLHVGGGSEPAAAAAAAAQEGSTASAGMSASAPAGSGESTPSQTALSLSSSRFLASVAPPNPTSSGVGGPAHPPTPPIRVAVDVALLGAPIHVATYVPPAAP